MATHKAAATRGKFYVRASFVVDGKRYRPTATLEATTRTIKRVAEAWEAEQLEAARAAVVEALEADDPDPSRPTLSTAWAELIEVKGGAWSPAYRREHERVRFDVDVRDLGDGVVLGEIPLHELRRLHVSQYLTAYAGSTIRGGVQPGDRAIEARLKAIRAAVNYAVDEGLLERDVTRKLAPPTGRFIEDRDPLDLKWLNGLLLGACARLTPSQRYLDRGDRAVFMPLLCTLAVYTGARRSEILGIRFRDVTYHADGSATVKIRRAVTSAPAAEGGYRVGPTKTKRRRQVPLAPEAAQIIGARRLALEAEAARNDVPVDVGEAFVFSATFGQHPLRPSSVRSWWDALRAVEPALQSVTFKDQRTAQSVALNAKIPHRQAVADHLGHRVEVNAEHYDGRAPGDLEAIRSTIVELLSN